MPSVIPQLLKLHTDAVTRTVRHSLAVLYPPTYSQGLHGTQLLQKHTTSGAAHEKLLPTMSYAYRVRSPVDGLLVPHGELRGHDLGAIGEAPGADNAMGG